MTASRFASVISRSSMVTGTATDACAKDLIRMEGMTDEERLPEPILGDRLAEAAGYAIELHARQSRKGTTIPYVVHLFAVCSLALEDGADEDEAIAALLHDGPEDQGSKPRWMRSAAGSVRWSRCSSTG